MLIKNVALLLLASSFFISGVKALPQRPSLLVPIGGGVQYKHFGGVVDERQNFGRYVEASLYALDVGPNLKGVGGNSGYSIGGFYEIGLYGMYFEKNQILWGTAPYPWLILAHGFSYGGSLGYDRNGSLYAYASPHVKYWICLGWLGNVYEKIELKNFYKPQASIGWFYKVPFPLIQ